MSNVWDVNDRCICLLTDHIGPFIILLDHLGLDAHDPYWCYMWSCEYWFLQSSFPINSSVDTCDKSFSALRLRSFIWVVILLCYPCGVLMQRILCTLCARLISSCYFRKIFLLAFLSIDRPLDFVALPQNLFRIHPSALLYLYNEYLMGFPILGLSSTWWIALDAIFLLSIKRER